MHLCKKINFFLLGIYLLWSSPIFCQDFSNTLATNFQADGKVIELTLPENFEGVRFIMLFVKNGESYGKYFFCRAGKHYYDFRDHSEWNGKIETLVTSLPEHISGQLVNTSLSNEIDIFLTPVTFSTTTINFAWLKTFFGIRWSILLFFFAVFTGVLTLFFAKVKPIIAAIVGVMLAFVIMDFRGIYDRIHVIQNIEKTQPYVAPLQTVQKFSKKARSVIGNSLWAIRKVDYEIHALYIKSQLADLPAIRFERPKDKEIFIITNNPGKKANVVLQEGNFFLVRRPAKK